MQQYDELFEARGSSYDVAMRRFPSVRRDEFAQVVEAAALHAGMIVGDVPAGGGYLQSHLPPYCQYRGHEPCGAFAPHQDASSGLRALLPLPWQDNALDVVISLAGIHHVDDKRALFSDMYRVTRPGGGLVISDVAEGSAVAHFLDGFVGLHNSTGHEGSYLNADTANLLNQTGWQIVSDETRQIFWYFNSADDLATFCALLFDIRLAGPAEIIDAVRSMLGVQASVSGGIDLCWSLRTIAATKVAGLEP